MKAHAARRIIAAVALCSAALACSSSATTGSMRMYQQQEERVWAAAIRAVQDVGADIVTMNRSAGVILARMPFEVLGTSVDLSISVSSSSGRSEPGAGADVQVKASESGGHVDDPERLRELRDLEQRYLEMVDAELAGAGRSPRPF